MGKLYQIDRIVYIQPTRDLAVSHDGIEHVPSSSSKLGLIMALPRTNFDIGAIRIVKMKQLKYFVNS